MLLITVIAAYGSVNAQKNGCAGISIQNVTTDACAGDFRNYVITTANGTEQVTVSVTSSNSGDIIGVIGGPTSQLDGTWRTDVGLQYASYSGPPHTSKTYLRTITMNIQWKCCGVWYSTSRTVNVYDCPFR